MYSGTVVVSEDEAEDDILRLERKKGRWEEKKERRVNLVVL